MKRAICNAAASVVLLAAFGYWWIFIREREEAKRGKRR